jgi:adenylate kinase
MNEMRTVFFVGKPGCGKGTQAKLLSQETGWPNISAGKQFRGIATEDTVLGHKVKTEIESGALMPHWFAMYLYQKALFSVAEDSGVIFDGFNRKVPEAELIIASLSWLSRPFKVVNLVVSDEVVRRRLVVRKETDGRADDAVVEERLREYREHTEASIELFRKHGNLVEINGEQEPEQIARDIKIHLGLA